VRDYTEMVLLVPFLLVLVPFGITLLVPSWRIAMLTSVLGGAAAWVLIARFTYHSPIPLNEPEWWGGLAIVWALAVIGVTIGVFVRRRQARSVPD
jgi:uncharacterized membrane protein